jgi:hypothetical protein
MERTLTLKDKQLLLSDLCARVPYGVKAQVLNYVEPQVVTSVKFNMMDCTIERDSVIKHVFTGNDQYVKPYLRSMSSMTEDELLKLESFKMRAINSINLQNSVNYVKWLIEKHFDYQGLIPKGLALEATPDMYNN